MLAQFQSYDVRYYMKKIAILLLIFSSAIVFTAAKNKATVVHDIPSGLPHDNWFPIGENHGLMVVGYEKSGLRKRDILCEKK